MYLLEWFGDLSSARRSGANGPDPIGFSDIEAWSRLTGTIVRREELIILRQMDAAWCRAVAQEHAQTRRDAEGRSKAQAQAKAMLGKK
jgi:hypothetical protein